MLHVVTVVFSEHDEKFGNLEDFLMAPVGDGLDAGSLLFEPYACESLYRFLCCVEVVRDVGWQTLSVDVSDCCFFTIQALCVLLYV